jgi:threonine 3-dehydrogenase
MKNEYKVLVKAEPGPGGMALVPRTLRALDADEALVRIHHAAICGTDLHIVQWNAWAAKSYKPPLALGHELSGVVVAKGSSVREISVGDKVAVETHLECGECAQCRIGRGHTCLNLRVFSRLDRGAFAEYAIVPAAMLRALPRDLPHRQACLMEPLGIAVRAVTETRVGAGNLLVVGCGPIGLLAVAAAKALGVGTVLAADLSAARRQLALAMGADAAVDPRGPEYEVEAARVASSGGFDASIDSSGSPAGIAAALAAVRPGGSLVMVGMPPEPVSLDLARHVILREVQVRGTYGRLLRETWAQVTQLLPRLSAALDRIVTHEFALEDYETAFRVASSGDAGKVLFRVNSDEQTS